MNREFLIAVEHHRNGRAAEAQAIYRRILLGQPEHADALHMLGLLAAQGGHAADGIALIERAISIDSSKADFFADLGLAYAGTGRTSEAIAAYRRAIALDPASLSALNNLGNLLKNLGEIDEAVTYLHKASELRPDLPEPLANLANALKERGDLDEALACLRKAASRGDHPQVASNLLFTMHFDPAVTPEQLFEEHSRWDERYAAALAREIQPHRNDRTSDRKLRIGYVSADLRNHPVGRFMLPLLENHDRESFEVFCYSGTRREDETSARLKSHCDTWRQIAGTSDAQLAQLIREDRIDVLVDLAMHTDAGRLLAFARKPAPVQVTYLAYCGTTGLRAMDYRLTDPYLDPPGGNERVYCERSIRLPRSYWCYQAPADAPPVGALPALSAGHVTFGCFNHAAKINWHTLRIWRELLACVPKSRLKLHAARGEHRRCIAAFMAEAGIDEARLEFVDRLPYAQYLRGYQQIDIALDPFPYAGGTTTCDALWMGVPVVTLAGQTAVSRSGASILSNAGLPELVARDAREYVRMAAELAGDLDRLRGLRDGMRERMARSPLLDAHGFARSIELALRNMWKLWCIQ
ncbi:MAG TPA: tetratricopeptide repeat protein [Humisphaera sp.]|nr:tetratricopeptide repeat protein [Humisphaera sp.]